MQTLNKIIQIKLLFIVILISNVLSCCAQSFDNSSYKDSLIQKSKSQKTAARIMLYGGTALSVVGLAITISEVTDKFLETETIYRGSSSSGGLVLMVVGLGLSVGSIPLFIASDTNRKNAMKLSAKAQEVKIPVSGGFANRYQPALSIKLVLGKR